MLTHLETATRRRDQLGKIAKGEHVLVLIGDIVSSGQLGRRRPALQSRLRAFVTRLNRSIGPAAISSGDEFELVTQSIRAIPDVLWQCETISGDVQVRLGIGFGELETPPYRNPLEMDGAAFRRARIAIDLAKRKKLLGGVFRGFSDPGDEILSGLAALMAQHREGWTSRQREIAELLRAGETQARSAERIGITRQTVSKHARAIGWNAYASAEQAFEAALSHFAQSNHGEHHPRRRTRT